jgi:2-methylfumaryl-CoA hydratase
VQSSDVFARAIGYPRAPVDDLLVFHVVFGKTGARHLAQRRRQSRLCGLPRSRAGVPGDTLSAVSEVIGLKENSSRKTGIVFVRSTGCKPDGSKVIEYVRWVMVPQAR